MRSIPTTGPSRDFIEAWVAAGNHLQRMAESFGLQPWWLRDNLEPPFLEHLSMRLGNQLIFIRLEGVDGPGSMDGVRAIARECEGHACVMPMKRSKSGWAPRESSWGLFLAPLAGHNDAPPRPLDPRTVMTDEEIEMTDWEVHDFAVSQVRQNLESRELKIMSSQGNPAVDPSLWFVGPQGPEWVVVRAARFPALVAPRPKNLPAIAARCARMSRLGHFASISVASADGDGPTGRLVRGSPLDFRFSGLERLS